MLFRATTSFIKPRLYFLVWILILGSAGSLHAQDESSQTSIPTYASSVAWSPDGTRIAVSHGPIECNLEGQEYVVDIVSMATDELIDQIPIETGCVPPSIEWNFDGSRLVITGSPDSTSTIWNMVAAPQVITQSEALAGAQAADVWSPDGVRIAHVEQDQGVTIWDARRGANVTTCCTSTSGEQPVSVAWSSGTANMVTGFASGHVAIWDSRDFRQLKTLGGHTASVQAVAFNWNGEKIATADMDGLIQIWDGLTGEHLLEFQNPAHTGIRIIKWNPSGDQLATAGDDGKVHVWDTISGEEIATIEGGTVIHDLDWSPDGTRLVFGGEGMEIERGYTISIAPVPRYCDLVVEPTDTLMLVDAINEANSSSFSRVICLTESTYLFSPESNTVLFDVDGMNALPTITTTVIVNGNGATLERDPASEFPFRFFHVAGSGSLIVTNLTLSGGLATPEEDGGAILNKGMVTILNSTFLNNRGASGGALQTNGVITTVMDSEFTGNIASQDDGGAISNSGGVLEVIHSQFFDNEASDNGGAIDNDPGTLKAKESVFSFNSTGDDAGAIFNGGQLVLMDSAFRSNTSRDDGGAIRNHDTGTANMSGNAFDRNEAADEGGAIANDGLLTAVNNCFTNNVAVDYSSVSGVAAGTTITSNWWGSAGGPIPADEDNDGGMIDNEVSYEPFLTSDPGFCNRQ